MRNLSKFMLGLAIAGATTIAPACECREKGVFEKAGDKIDQAGEEINEAVTGKDDRVDDVVDEMRDVGDEIREKVNE